MKVGHNTSGSQRYLCKGCRHKYTPEPKLQGYDETHRQQALQLYVDGVNLRRIERILGVSRQSVANWAKTYASQLPDQPPRPAETVDVAELDEVYTFVGTKKNACTSSRRSTGTPVVS